MKRIMSLCARCTVLIVIAVLAVMIYYISKMDYVRTEEIFIENYNGNICFNQSSGELSYSKGTVIDIETGSKRLEDIKITDIIYTDTYVGNKQVVTYVTDRTFNDCGGSSTIFLKYDSFFRYITDSNLSRESSH